MSNDTPKPNENGQLPFASTNGSASDDDIDLYAEHAKEKYSLSPAWRIYRWECLPHDARESRFINLTGAVAPNKTTGKHAGQPAWSKRDRTTDVTVTLTLKEHEEWKKEWEARTGKCSNCTGTGKVLESWSVKDGVKYRTCPKCKGSRMPNVKAEGL